MRKINNILDSSEEDFDLIKIKIQLLCYTNE